VDPFNRGKSYIKFLEYAALDMAIVCSDVPAYQTVARHGENALVVPNLEQAWYEAIRSLIVDGSQRAQLARNAREMVRGSCMIDHGSHDYLDAISVRSTSADQR